MKRTLTITVLCVILIICGIIFLTNNSINITEEINEKASKIAELEFKKTESQRKVNENKGGLSYFTEDISTENYKIEKYTERIKALKTEMNSLLSSAEILKTKVNVFSETTNIKQYDIANNIKELTDFSKYNK